MKVAAFSARSYDREFLAAATRAAGDRHQWTFLDARLEAGTAGLAAGLQAVCCFVNDRLDRPALQALHGLGVQGVALRSAGYNHVDLAAARDLGLLVARTPAYSPHAVAEHAVALMLALARRIPRAYARVRDGNFALDGLLGFTLHGKTVAVVGTGLIGQTMCGILAGFGCRLLAVDPCRNDTVLALGAESCALEDALPQADIVTLHCPLTPDTRHLLDDRTLALLKPGAMLINTGRGALIDTQAVIRQLKSGRLGHLGLDVYEEECGLFFEDRSGEALADDVFARLLTFPNVIVTGHQGFFTREALAAIAAATVENLDAFAAGHAGPNAVG